MDPIGAYADDLRLALEVVAEVDALTVSNFDSDQLSVELKPDDTPVTAVDRAAERLIRDRIGAARPDDAFLGEEYGAVGDSVRQWVVDPIDGTKNYIRGVPVWATLISLIDRGVPVVGVVSAPALGRRWYAAAGSGAWGESPTAPTHRLSVSSATVLAESSLSYSSLSGWEERGLLPAFLDLTRALWRTRAYGDFWSYMMVAEGQVDIACEPELALHDMAALVPIVEEAGGRFTSISGQAGPFGGDAVATNGMLHDEVLARLRG